MWYEISSERDINDFMKKINFFHDCCIKELKYSSAVSYTHLDVYKRQKYDRYGKYRKYRNADLGAHTPVSYTHLY